MNRLTALAIAASFMGFSLASHASESCPEIRNIEEVGSGVFRAAGKDGEWTGVLQGMVAEKTSVRAFETALAIQESASAPQKLQHCTYSTSAGKSLDMRFTQKNGQAFTIKTEGTAWRKEDGPFGLIYNLCENTSPEKCTFSVQSS